MIQDEDYRRRLQSIKQTLKLNCKCSMDLGCSRLASEVGVETADCSCAIEFKVSVKALKANIPISFWDMSLNDKRQNCLREPTIRAYAGNLTEVWREGHSLFLTGNNREQRLHHLLYLMMKIIRTTDYTAYYVNSRDWQQVAIQGQTNRQISNLQHAHMNRDFLAFDDYGIGQPSESPSRNLKNELSQTLIWRADHKLPVFFSTQDSLQEAKQRYPQGMEALLQNAVEVDFPPSEDVINPAEQFLQKAQEERQDAA